MAELVFIAATIFVAYTLFTILGDDNELPAEEKTPEVETESKAAANESESKPVTRTVTASSRKRTAPAKAVTAEKASAKPKPAAKPKTATKAAAEPKAVSEKKPATPSRAAKSAPVNTVEAVVATDSLKNPKTGEVVKIPNSYAFAKRWIKDALVEEKLLDKVYKNAELDNATNSKIQEAFEKLKQLPKYQ